MRTYKVWIVWFTFGRRVKRHSRNVVFEAHPLEAYTLATTMLLPGESISTFWYEI